MTGTTYGLSVYPSAEYENTRVYLCDVTLVHRDYSHRKEKDVIKLINKGYIPVLDSTYFTPIALLHAEQDVYWLSDCDAMDVSCHIRALTMGFGGWDMDFMF